MGHQGSLERKIQAIEYLDDRVIRVIKEKMDDSGEPYRMLILPDHPTPICKRTHTGDPVLIFFMTVKKRRRTGVLAVRKRRAESGVFEPHGHLLLGKLFR